MILSNNVLLIHEDEHILVCKKPAGLATQTASSRQLDLVSILKRYLYSINPSNGEPYLGIIHRLDQPVRGLLVFAKTPLAAKVLSQQVQNHSFGKFYLALLTTAPQKDADTWTHYLLKDSKTNTSQACTSDTPGSKRACLQYKVLSPDENTHYALFSDIGKNLESYPLVEIQLETGRHHQIRVQTSHMQCPILGDAKYGLSDSDSTWSAIALCAYKLNFKHPLSGNVLTFEL